MPSWTTLGLALCICTASAARAGEIAGKVDATPAKYLDETVVYVEKAPGTFAPKTHKMDQKGMKFVPHLLTITAGDTVEFLNSDGVEHNVYSPDNEGYNLGMIASKKDGKHTFDKPGVYSQLCSVHPEMLAYVIVGQNPFAAVVGKDGKYKIEGVPPGEYTVLVWNSHLKAPSAKVTVGAGKAEANFSVKR
jgi:plastocyanin